MKALQAIAIASIITVVALAICFVQHDGGDSNDDGYLYAIYTDSETNLDVIDVYESHIEDGKATAPVQRYRTSGSPDSINPFWAFDRTTGKGPFNSFYAAINLTDNSLAYSANDSVQKRMSSSVGCVAYILDPYDLTKTMEGNGFDAKLYNVMLIVPTVYWVSEKVTAGETSGNLVKGKEYNVLYVSSSPEYALPGHGTIGGMKAYAHSASTVPGKTDFETNVYPYLGIGVYESYVTVDGDPSGEGMLVSQSGRVPSAHIDVDGFRDLADSLVPASGGDLQSDYQQWNYYQWTLYKIMSYTVMGSKNSQVMVGDGYVLGNDPPEVIGNDSPAVTGSTDGIGFMGIADETKSASGAISSDTGRTSSKLFIENGWGSLNVFVGDAYVTGTESSELHLHAGNYLGGSSLIDSRDQPLTQELWADIFSTGTEQYVISSASAASATWDTPTSSNGNRDSYTDPDYPGDMVNGAESGVLSITVGGRWNKAYRCGTAFACAGYEIDLANEYRGARLAYLMSDDTLRASYP